MPDFEFTSPEGKKYTISGPAGATKEQAFGILQQQLGAAPKGSTGDQVPNTPRSGPADPRDVKRAAELAAPERTSADDNIVGKLFGPVDVGISVLSSMIGGAVAPTAGFVKSIVTGKGDPEANAGQIMDAMQYQPRTGTGAQLASMVGKVAAPLGALPTATMVQGAQAAAPLANLAGNAVRAGAGQVGAAAGAAAKGMIPKIDPRTAELAQKAQQYDIPLRPDMLSKNKVLRMMGEASEKVPLSGSMAEPRQQAFNKAIIGTIGGDETATRLTPDVFDKAIRQSGQKIGDIAAKTPLPVDADLSAALKSHIENAAKFETSDVAKVITSYVDELTSKASDGFVSGEAFRKLNTKINNQMRSTSNGDLKNALGGLQDDLQDALQRNLTGEDLAALQAARRQYAIAKTIEPLVAKSASGDISPAGLMGRVTSNNAGKSRMARGNGGDIGDLARIGQAFLKEPPSSGTAERGLAYGVLGGGAALHPGAAAGAFTAANVYNRTGAALARKLSDLSGKVP